MPPGKYLPHGALALALLFGCGGGGEPGRGAPPSASLASSASVAKAPSTPAPAISSSAPGAGVASSSEPVASPPEAPQGMKLVPGGRFRMGADDAGEMDERPMHDVTVGSFFLDVTEATNAAYGACVKVGACRKHDPGNAAKNGFVDRSFRGPNQPISAISWDDATAYCAFVGKRLPTEAEWERAARGDDARKFPWGDELPDRERAVFDSGSTMDVGAHPKGAGPFGHQDLAGNVWEWVADMYDPYAYARAGAAMGTPGSCKEILAAQDELRNAGRQGFTGQNPIPTECERVLRGGAFNYPKKGLRSSNRVHHPGRFRLVMSGFRCAKDVGGPSP